MKLFKKMLGGSIVGGCLALQIPFAIVSYVTIALGGLLMWLGQTTNEYVITNIGKFGQKLIRKTM